MSQNQLPSASTLTEEQIEEIAPIALVHEDVETFKAFSKFRGLNGSTSVFINETKELVKRDILTEDDCLHFAYQLFFPHRSILMPILKDRLELLE